MTVRTTVEDHTTSGFPAEQSVHVANRSKTCSGPGGSPGPVATLQGRCIAPQDLLTIAAHDIRNYLTPMQGRTALLSRRASRAHRHADIRDLAALERSIERLSLLVGNVLDTARLGAGLFSIRPQPVDIVELARETAEAMENGAVSVRVEATTDCVTLSVDPERVRQALENLVANAVRYSPDSGTVVISVARTTADNAEKVVVSIEDQGPGVPAELLPYLFAPLGVGPGSVGLGLGLYLAREIAEAHGGSLVVESPPTGGARFVLTLLDQLTRSTAPDLARAESLERRPQCPVSVTGSRALNRKCVNQDSPRSGPG
jgi:two-component system, OmpR family, sensor kinase